MMAIVAYFIVGILILGVINFFYQYIKMCIRK